MKPPSVVSLAGVLGFLLACSSGATGPDPDPDGDPTTVTLTITVKAMEAGYIPGVVYAHIGDGVESRIRMPLLFGENDAVAKPFGERERTVTLSVPRGKTVTLFAAEFGHYGVNARVGGTGPLSKEPPADATEFTAWSGATGRLITAEEGVASIVMNSDANVTAEFRKLAGFTVDALGCADIRYTWVEPPYLGYGITQEQGGTIGSQTHGPTPVEDDWFFVYGPQGSHFTFTAQKAESRNPSNQTTGFMNWAGGAGSTSSCGIALTCNVPMPPRGTDPVKLTVRNSWILAATPNGAGCGACVSPEGSCNLPFRP
jgi:hypothetical protein